MPEKPTDQDLVSWVEQNPNSYWGLRGLAEIYVSSGRFEQAKEVLEKLQELGSMTGESGDPLVLLARVYRELGEPDQERETLEQLVSLSSNSLPALRRLIEISREREQWERVAMFADQILAINPLLPEGHQALSEAAEALERPQDVVRALGPLAEMDPVDPAAIDYRMARAYAKLDDPVSAKRHVLRALEEAPRYRDAHRLLIELSEQSEPANEDVPTSEDDVNQEGCRRASDHGTEGGYPMMQRIFVNRARIVFALLGSIVCAVVRSRACPASRLVSPGPNVAKRRARLGDQRKLQVRCLHVRADSL